MNSTEHLAIWLNSDGTLSPRWLPSPQPGKGEAIVKVLFSGVNPADTKHARLGVHQTVSGYDFCGKITEADKDCKYKVGDLIAGYTPSGIGRPAHYGTHQDYLIYPDDGLAFVVPAQMKLEDAASLMVVVRTAADALFNLLNYPLPGTNTALPNEGLLVWGGATSLGTAAIQFSRSIGVNPIIATASSENHELLLQLGASKCFDYKDGNVIDNIRDYITRSGAKLKCVFDAAGIPQQNTTTKAASCGGEDVKIVCATGQGYPAPLATTEKDMDVIFPGRGRMTIPKRVEDAQRAQQALLWAVDNYGKEFVLPKVTVVSGKVDEAIAVIQAVGESKAGFGKFVIEHPLHE